MNALQRSQERQEMLHFECDYRRSQMEKEVAVADFRWISKTYST